MDNKFEEAYNRVINWAKTGTADDFWGTPEHYDVCWKMVGEELNGPNELKDSFRKQDPVGVVDGLCDLFVTVAQVVELNTDNLTQDQQYASELMSIQKFLALAEPIVYNKKNESVFYLMSALCRAMDQCNYPIEECMNEVLSSNESKFWPVDALQQHHNLPLEEAIEAECRWIESNRKDCNNVVGQIKNGMVVFRKDGGLGKILKSSRFCEPNLKQYVEQIEGDV